MYAGEWHPDYLVIVCAMSGCFFLEKIISQEQIKYHLGYTISLILCGISKQTGVIFYFAYVLYIIFCPELSIKRKGILFLEMFLSGIIVLSIIFNIHGCYITTVYTMSKHSLIDLSTNIKYWKGTIHECWFFLLLIILYGIRYTVNKIKNRSHKFSHIVYIWEICACLWFIVSIAGSFKYGSNKGNIEAGLIIWMPFAIYTLVDLFSKIIEKKIVLIHILTGFLISIGALYILILSKKQISNDIVKYKSRLADQQMVEEYLNENFAGKTIAYNAAYYFYVCNAEIDLSTDTHLIHHYYYADLFDSERFNYLAKMENWDIIVWLEQWDNAGGLIIPEGYEVKEIDDLNCLGKIYVKKNNKVI